MGDPRKKNYAIHIVNEGPSRLVTIKGLPEKFKRLQVYVTDQTKGMEPGELATVTESSAQIQVQAACFIILTSE